MKQIVKSPEKIMFTTDIDISLANAIRRSINEIMILAVEEVDIYKNDSALYDQIIAHRIGLIPLKNQKLKEAQTVSLKLNVKGGEVLSGALGSEVIYPEMPVVYLEKGQELELVARARQGTGKEHAKFVPGLVYYRHLNKIEIGKEGEKHSELAELFPKIFEFDGKLKVKNEYEIDLDEEDLKDFKGVSVTSLNELIFVIESWGMIDAKDIFLESVKVLKDNLAELSKKIKQ